MLASLKSVLNLQPWQKRLDCLHKDEKFSALLRLSLGEPPTVDFVPTNVSLRQNVLEFDDPTGPKNELSC